MQQRTIQILSILLLLGLILWGGYSFLVYLGIPVHVAVLLSESGRGALGACGSADYACRGVLALFPFITHAVARLSPFYPYALLSILVYAGFLGWQYVRTKSAPRSVALRLWHVPFLFVALLWLLFTTLSFGGAAGQSIRTVYEPTAEAYGDLSEGAMTQLQANFDNLVEQGCLQQEGETAAGTGIYRLSTLCTQTSFVTRVLSQALLIFFFLAELIILGFAILTLLKARPRDPFLEFVFSLGLGVGGWITLLWIAAIAGQYTAPVGWSLAIFVPAVCYRSVLHWWRRLRDTVIDVPVGTWHLHAFLLWLLFSLLAFNFLTVVRPFPIGWDDLGSYVNRPRLLVSYGRFIPTMSTFQWEYLTSLGFLLFGFDSVFGATASMIINWAQGLLAALGVYAFGRLFFGRGSGVLSAFLYYILPLVGHFSFADMKIDNAVFFMGTLGALAVFSALFSDKEDEERVTHTPMEWRSLFLLGGIFVALSFSMKITAIMLILGLFVVIAGALIQPVVFMGGCLEIVVLLVATGAARTSQIFSRVGIVADAAQLPIIIAALVAIGLIGFGLVRGRRRILHGITALLLFGGAAALTIAPWVIHNNVRAGSFTPLIRTSAPNTDTPSIDLTITRETNEGNTLTLPPDLAVDLEHQECKGSGFDEELDRYWGFGKGWGHYVTLPWRTVMNADTGGYYVTTFPSLLLLPLVLLLPFCWMRRGRWLRWMTFLTLFIVFEWVFLANGVPWYGISMFLGLVLGLEGLVAYAPDLPNKIIASVLVGLSLLTGVAQRVWQFEQQQNLLEYPLGKVTAEVLAERTIPHYDDIRSIALERAVTLPDRPYLYRMGTFIPYFIPKNTEVMPVADNQLQLFNCIHQERDPALTVRRLNALGFNSMIFDTNTATIESDADGPLHRKVNAFVDFVNDPRSRMRIVVNDPAGGVAFMLLPDEDLPPEDAASNEP